MHWYSDSVDTQTTDILITKDTQQAACPPVTKKRAKFDDLLSFMGDPTPHTNSNSVVDTEITEYFSTKVY